MERSGIEGLGINFIEGLRLTKYKVQKSHTGGTFYVEPVNLPSVSIIVGQLLGII